MGMSITLTYTTSEGKEEQLEFEKDVKQIRLDNQGMVNIDLAPLNSCTNLHTLILLGNQLQNIDLAPLSSCAKLAELVLDSNQLQNIDLAPLRSCTNLQKLFLRGNQLQNINLSPLNSCTNLQELNLHHNQIQDLVPLNSCTNLQTLTLSGNQLQNIDIAPLSSCTNLHTLELWRNHLQNIDLEPLSSCTNLHTLTLYSNKIQNINLAPLSSCTNLHTLNLYCIQFLNIDPHMTRTKLQKFLLEYNQRQPIDVTPVFWFSCISSNTPKVSSWLQPRTKDCDCRIIYSSPVQLYPWSFLYKIIEQFKSDYRIQHDILAALGLADCGFVDCDLTDTLLAIAPETSNEYVREILIKFLVEEIAAAVDREGPTIGLNLESLITHRGEIEIINRSQRILELRKREIEQVRIYIEDEVVDLRELWLTAYGSEILQALGMRLTTDSGGLEQIKNALAELSQKLKMGVSLVSSVDMSNELKECIWWIADNNGKDWSRILKEDLQKSGTIRKEKRVKRIKHSKVPDGIKQTKIDEFFDS